MDEAVLTDNLWVLGLELSLTLYVGIANSIGRVLEERRRWKWTHVCKIVKTHLNTVTKSGCLPVEHVLSAA